MFNNHLVNRIAAFLIVAVSSISIIAACKNIDMMDPSHKDSLTSEPNGLIDTSLANLRFVSNPKNLNIIMFVPTDNPAISDYKPRLSQLFVHFQQWLHTEMARYGYDQYLGLSRADSSRLVHIVEIPAAGPQADYPYSAAISANKIIAEVNAFRAKHPEQFSSDRHYIILLPQRTDGFSEQPFYGWGKYCFAVDNASVSINHIPNPNSNLLGGMLHELGHGLNLPHNRAKYSSEANALGTSLMGSGNVSFSKGQPTFLTEVDAAILSKNEVFKTTSSNSPVYQTPTYGVYPKFHIDHAHNRLNIIGTFTSSLPVSDLLVYLDPNVNNEGTGANRDYNAVAWRFKLSSPNTIQGTIDLNELYYKSNTPYELKLKLLLDNGAVTNNVYDFKYVNGNLTSNQDSIFVYQHGSYNGNKAILGIGQYTTVDLIAREISNNDISSIKIGTNVKAILYDGDNFSGDSIIVQSSTSFLSTFNDKTSSIRVLLN